MALCRFEHDGRALQLLIRDDGAIGAIARELAAFLGYKRTKDALKLVTDPAWKCTLAQFGGGPSQRDPLDNGSTRRLTAHNVGQQTVVLEYGINAMLLGSRLPVGLACRRWLCSEVMPAIARTGTYSVATPLEDAHDVQELIRQHVSASVCLNPVVGADDTWYHEHEIGDVHAYRKPRDSIMHHARQAGPDSWRYLYELQPDCPRFQRKWRVYRKRVLVRTLLRGNKRKTKGLRRWALNDALPKGQPLRSQARRGSATLARALPP
jgi:prophage antirepressor-like protein